ncbi:MAG: DUF1189 family protein [bacterium]|nr:DUF1189 family protein [bacterium]
MIPHAPYYLKISHQSFSASFQYFIILLILCNSLFIGSLIIKENPFKIAHRLTIVINSLKSIPNDFKAHINNGIILTSYNHPFFLWNYEMNNPLLLVIDETAFPQKINDYKSLILVTSRDLVINSNKLTIVPLSSFKNMIITKVQILNVVNTLEKIKIFLPLIYAILVLLILIIIPLGSFIIMGLYFVVSTAIGYSIYRLYAKKRVHFKKILQISFHSVTLPLVLDYLIIIIKPLIYSNSPISIPSSYYPILFILLLSVFIFAGIYEAHNTKNSTK